MAKQTDKPWSGMANLADSMKAVKSKMTETAKAVAGAVKSGLKVMDGVRRSRRKQTKGQVGYGRAE